MRRAFSCVLVPRQVKEPQGWLQFGGAPQRRPEPVHCCRWRSPSTARRVGTSVPRAGRGVVLHGRGGAEEIVETVDFRPQRHRGPCGLSHMQQLLDTLYEDWWCPTNRCERHGGGGGAPGFL